MPIPSLRHLPGLAVTALLLSILAPRAAQAQPYAHCDKGFEPTSTTNLNGVIIRCVGKVTTTVRNYVTYQPCTPPGAYYSNDETPTGSAAGRDRCTAAGFSGPALPCAAGLSVEIVKGGKDKCYSNSSTTETIWGEVRCYRVENNVKVACRLF